MISWLRRVIVKLQQEDEHKKAAAEKSENSFVLDIIADLLALHHCYQYADLEHAKQAQKLIAEKVQGIVVLTAKKQAQIPWKG